MFPLRTRKDYPHQIMPPSLKLTVFKYTVQRSREKGGIEDISKINFLLFNENKCCDPSLEASQ